MDFSLRVALPEDVQYATQISKLYAQSAQKRGTGIAVRSPEYLVEKIKKGNGK